MYKIILNGKVIDAVKVPHFFRVLPTGHITFTDKTSAHGIIGSNNKTLYAFIPLPNKELDIVTIEEITLNEFDSLNIVLKSGYADNSNLTKAKQNTIERISNLCKSKITDGFSVKLSDGKKYDFMLTIEDQLNLLAIENELKTDTEHFLYHAAGQQCKFFSREDMSKVISAFRKHVLYHTTYFNIAKQYINSLTELEPINKFTYGIDVSSATTDPVIKQILKNGGNL